MAISIKEITRGAKGDNKVQNKPNYSQYNAVKVAEGACNLLRKDSVVQHNHTVFRWTDLNFTFC